MSFLEARGIVKRYTVGGNDLNVLRDLDLTVEAGEMVAIMGASGVGKSTLLHILGGLDRADRRRGHGRVDESDRAAGCRCRWRSEIATSDSSFSSTICFLNSALSKTSRCRCASRGSAWPKRALARKSCCNAWDSASGRPIVPGCCRAGEQQRVAVARALIMRPALLLADEPTGDLDEQTAESLHRLLREMHAAYGLTSVIATHNPRLAEACDRVLRLEGGRLSAA